MMDTMKGNYHNKRRKYHHSNGNNNNGYNDTMKEKNKK